jgi:two-component system, LytTR family, response regulator
MMKQPISLPERGNPKLEILSNNRYCFVDIQDIILITRENRRTIIYVTGALVIPTYESLKKLEERLPDFHFFRCHKAFIINPEKVTEILPWGSKTYLVKLANINITALMTQEKVEEFQERYWVI